MDWLTGKEQVLQYIKKYRYVLAVLLVGLFFMLLPTEEETVIQPEPVITEENPTLQESLAGILSKISGAGKVEVLLTQSAGEQTIYQTNENTSANDVRKDTVLITNSEREEAGLIKQINPPTYLGAIILCQGADSANVRLSIVEAVMSVTGLSSDCITVLKMK